MTTYSKNNVFGCIVSVTHPTIEPLYDEFSVIIASASGIVASQYALDYAATLHPDDPLYTYSIIQVTNLNTVALTD